MADLCLRLLGRKCALPNFVGVLGIKQFKDTKSEGQILPSINFFNCKKKTLDSLHWKGILSIKPIIKKCLLWRVGQRDSINYWEEPWIRLNHMFLPTPTSRSCLEKCGMVNSLFMATGFWNNDLLEELFNQKH